MSDSGGPARQEFANERLVIMSAPNGARRMPDEHSSLPITPNQIAECASSLVDASVSVLHMHVRDENNLHTLDTSRYRAAIDAVESTIGDALIIQVTTEAVGRFKPDEQMHMVRDLRPEAVSLALRELCSDEAAESSAGAFFEWIVSERIWPQYILYSVEDVERFDRLCRKGLFADDQPFCMLVLGQYAAGREGNVSELDQMLEAGANRYPWSVCCFGRDENAAALHAASVGGHVRIGFENNVLLLDGSVAIDNTRLINQFNAMLPESTRKAATAYEIREQWLAT